MVILTTPLPSYDIQSAYKQKTKVIYGILYIVNKQLTYLITQKETLTLHHVNTLMS